MVEHPGELEEELVSSRQGENYYQQPDLDLYAQVEDLAGQEQALLEIPHGRRTDEQHRLVAAIGAELDRVTAKLHERAKRADPRADGA
jgi:tryptophan 2,3-dioxygenase